ncbi:MAG: hypothetical protein ACXQT6_01325 [Candidatus Methanospirareceae archaeon]
MGKKASTRKERRADRKGRTMRCPYCGYEWEPRVRRPKECPLCKRYLIRPVKKRR